MVVRARTVIYLAVVLAGLAGGVTWLVVGQGAETARSPLDEVQDALDEDAQLGRFTGRIGDFTIFQQTDELPAEASIFACPDGAGTAAVTDPSILHDHELWADEFGGQGVGWRCPDSEIMLINNEGEDEDGVTQSGEFMARGYIAEVPVPLVRDAPEERLELVDIRGYQGLLEHPIEGYPYSAANLAVIERLPVEETPGIVILIEGAPSAERATELAESLLR